jgi:hypothetical protein
LTVLGGIAANIDAAMNSRNSAKRNFDIISLFQGEMLDTIKSIAASPNASIQTETEKRTFVRTFDMGSISIETPGCRQAAEHQGWP